MAKLIVLEGLDGSGKGTQTQILADRLRAGGRKVRKLEFPAYASDGSMLVRMYLSGRFGEKPEDTNAYAASMFFAADRYASYASDWKRDMEDPQAVILANRYTTANAYHQLSKLPREDWDAFLGWLWDFEFAKLGLPAPDLVILLDMPERVSSALVRKRSAETGRAADIHERDGAYLRRSREAAAYAAEKCGWTVISCAAENADAPDPVSVIADKVFRAAFTVL
ncbi:MAG: thymidylate kinase [Clostridiales bacterium]|nr:thymidylate kinase [Clostridiales bacterium]